MIGLILTRVFLFSSPIKSLFYTEDLTEEYACIYTYVYVYVYMYVYIYMCVCVLYIYMLLLLLLLLLSLLLLLLLLCKYIVNGIFTEA